MFTLFLTIEPTVQSIQPRSRVVLSPCSLGWLKETLPRGRTLALLVVLSIIVVPVVSCAPPSIVFPLEPATTPAAGANPRIVLPYSELVVVDPVNQRGMVGRN